MRARVVARAPQLLAPRKAIEAVEAATTLPFAEGLRKEAELFRECLFSNQSKALIHVFFGEREVAKVPGIPRETPTVPIKRAAIVGAGTMGGGIAMVYANAGIPVLLKEMNQEALDRGLDKIRKNYAATVQKGRLTAQQMDERLARIEPTLSYDRFAEADIVVEAVFEGMELKKQVFAELDRVVRPDAILASNTSTLDIDAIAAATGRPEQVIGHHYFSPANVMRLLEIVRGRQTSPAVLATSMALAKTLAKVGVVVGNCRGFVGNRMFGPYQREAQFLAEEGARSKRWTRHWSNSVWRWGRWPSATSPGSTSAGGSERNTATSFRRGSANPWSRTASAKTAITVRRPVPAGTSIPKGAAARFPTPRSNG